jgi:hypothetical protein
MLGLRPCAAKSDTAWPCVRNNAPAGEICSGSGQRQYWPSRPLRVKWRHCLLNNFNDGTVVWLTALSHDRQCCRIASALGQRDVIDSAVNHVTALSMWCDSAVNHVTALSMPCDSTVDHVTVPSLMWWHCWGYATVLSNLWQCRHINNGTAAWSTVLSHDQQCCRITNLYSYARKSVWTMGNVRLNNVKFKKKKKNMCLNAKKNNAWAWTKVGFLTPAWKSTKFMHKSFRKCMSADWRVDHEPREVFLIHSPQNCLFGTHTLTSTSTTPGRGDILGNIFQRQNIHGTQTRQRSKPVFLLYSSTWQTAIRTLTLCTA